MAMDVNNRQEVAPWIPLQVGTEVILANGTTLTCRYADVRAHGALEVILSSDSSPITPVTFSPAAWIASRPIYLHPSEDESTT